MARVVHPLVARRPDQGKQTTTGWRFRGTAESTIVSRRTHPGSDADAPYHLDVTLLYRALWQEAAQDPAVLIEASRQCFSRWASEARSTHLPDGTSSYPGREMTLRSGERDGLQGFEGVFRHTLGTDSRVVWTTTVRVVGTFGRTLTWIDCEVESDRLAERITFGRPGLVSDLLALPGEHKLGGSRVQTGPINVTSGEVPVLVSHLRDPDRSLPVVVFSAVPPSSSEEVDPQQLAKQTARRTEGIARVITLDQDAVTAFKDELGQLAVWGGGARTYVPARLEGPSDGWRHRYIPASRMSLSWRPVDRLVNALARLSTRRRPPEEFGLFTETQDVEFSALHRDFEQLQFELDLEREERAEVEQQLGRAQGHLGRLRERLNEEDLGEIYWGAIAADPARDEPDDDVQDVTTAVVSAQLHLSSDLSIPDSAMQELEDIDSAPNASAWGNTTWRGLRALATYTRARRDGFAGDFWIWCQRGEVFAWPATTKKLAMKESESVRNSGSLFNARIFAIDSTVDSSGRIFMESHLKISEGGGDLAPRLYFLDDTGGVTGKVHVGFVGPHRLVPNTKA